MRAPRVAVVGVGSIGSMVLWQLSRSGFDAVGFEQFGTAHDRSAAGGESRMFRTAYMEGANYVPLLKEARKLWAELEDESGLELLTMTGGLMIGPRDHYKIANVIQSTQDFDIEHEILEPADVAERFPQHILDEGEVAVLDHEAGLIRPELAVFAAVDAAERRGAVVHRHARVDDIVEDADRVQVVVGDDVHDFDAVVVTAGPWTPRFFPALADDLVARKIVMTWYLSDDPARFTPGAFPVFGRVGGVIDTFGVPSLEGTMTKIGSVNTFGDISDPDRLGRDIELDELTHINNEVSRCINGLRPDPARISVHMDGYTTDEHPVVGKAQGSERITVMGGYSGHGFKLAPVMGRIGCELATTGETSFAIPHMNPQRFDA
ncbi:N-methyl-L-tryptophan oxidase [Brevibacterium jeotgali]|uniref:Sarcosine oxidase n=1 Tax=Brevibacterium jeotgali TaxID=1262550 RepID=A0A2H1L6X9_9MICO|nr:N-methyl-L-tryptophan oxidase [Brevibacterium jeotgali]TWC02292.1 sarcosine oxidase [Brevibacterium jeotgali]SMY12656.1 sarcosine oxidase [Brevibacterium jeotgali]